MVDKPLAGLRVLLIEDEPLIALDVEELCLDLGAAKVVIVRQASEIEHISLGEFDLAVVDILLGAESSLHIADLLVAADVPFVFASGYAHMPEVAERFPEVPLVGKPYSGATVIEALTTVMAAKGSRNHRAENLR